MPHYFSLAEANAALEVIKPLMKEIQAIRNDILAHQPEAWPVVAKAAGNGGSKAASLLARDFEHLDRLVHLVQDTGAIIKDLDTGLLDFPAWRNEREVYLCWRFGEERVDYWHEVEAGFAGRQPISTF
jgi:hypothetical protein